jgi:hypothetical protein
MAAALTDDENYRTLEPSSWLFCFQWRYQNWRAVTMVLGLAGWIRVHG